MKLFSAIFTQQKSESIAAFTEKELIAQIREWLADVCPQGVSGIGDDAAVLVAKNQMPLMTTDSVVLGRHFEWKDSGQLVGQKLMERNLSDIAAMGGVPDAAVVSLFLSPEISIDWLHDFYVGMAQSGREANVLIVGGDITHLKGPQEFAANVTLLGYANRYLTRLGGHIGDSLFVTGALGGSLAKGRHLNFRARLKPGQWLAQALGVRAMMDISDGLYKDLPDMMGPGMSAQIDLAQIPLHPDAILMSEKTGKSPLEHAMSDGEDYELLVVVDEKENPHFLNDWKNRFPQLSLTRIGRLIQSPCLKDTGLLIDSVTGQPLLGEGYDSNKAFN